ncbi:MAG: ribonuclease R [Ignavibacteriales bacterium]
MNEEIKIKIMNALIEEHNPMEAIDISRKTNLDLRAVCEALIELEKELRVRLTKKGKYACSDYIFGKLSVINSGAGFVISYGNKDVYIKKGNLKNAIDGDNVVIEIIDEAKNEGKIIKILSHDKDYEVGQVVTIDNEQYIKLDDVKKRNILLALKDKNLSLVDGHKVTVKIGSLIKENVYSGYVIKVFGHVNDPGIDIVSKAMVFNIDIEFPDDVMEEVNNIPNTVLDNELIDRRDLRDKTIFTIDGDDAKDLDDAVSIEILPNGNYLLGVHIADVNHYVKKGSHLDKEAYKRGTSCYLADRVIPMIPHKLSNGICSLNGNVDRLTKTCMMEIDKKGNLINYDIFNSVINSKKRMTYKKVNDVLGCFNTDETYEPFKNDLIMMKQLSDILRRKRENNGSIDFDTTEMKIIVNECGRAIDILNKTRIESEKIIEDFMIEANVTVATHVSYMDLPFVYRVHGEPNEDKLKEFIKFVRLVSDKVVKLPKNMHPKAIRQIVESLKDDPEYGIYSNLLLRCMQKAVYDVNNIGHFGLSLDNYTHFTSPIRRYPDLLVHRALDQYQDQKYINNENKLKSQLEYLTEASKHSSLKEQNADKCEREVNKMKAAEYMEDHIGETFTGKATSVMEMGIYVDIYNGAEGLIKLINLDKGTYDPETFTIYTADGIQYRIGDQLEVIVDSSVKELGQINLSLVRKLEKVKTLQKNSQ